jgi:hypothetical protein
LFDESGCVNGKRDADVHALRVWYDDALSCAAFTSVLTGERFVFDLEDSSPKLEAWRAWLPWSAADRGNVKRLALRYRRASRVLQAGSGTN